MKEYQKIASYIFVISSILFGITGVLMILLPRGRDFGDLHLLFFNTLATLVFVILSSFGVSVGLKYLFNNK